MSRSTSSRASAIISERDRPAQQFITTTRAYDELEAQGLINTVAGKGCFVAEPDLALFREQSLHLLEDHLAAAAELARTCGLSESELAELLRRKWEGSL